MTRTPLSNPLWLCSYVAMWLCGYVAMSYVAIWLCGYVAMWLSGYVAKWSPSPSTYRLPPLHPTEEPKVGAQKLYTDSVLGGRTCAPPDPPIYVGGSAPPHHPFKSASGLLNYWFFSNK